MKQIALLILTFAVALPDLAAEEVQAGPRGGRLLALDGQKAEFKVEADRTVTVAFYDDALNKVAPAGQVVTATAEAPSGKVKLEFQPKGDLLASSTPLPEGTGYNVVVQIRPAPEAKPRNFRITLDAHICSGCQRPEYACTCGH